MEALPGSSCCSSFSSCWSVRIRELGGYHCIQPRGMPPHCCNWIWSFGFFHHLLWLLWSEILKTTAQQLSYSFSKNLWCSWVLFLSLTVSVVWVIDLEPVTFPHMFLYLPFFKQLHQKALILMYTVTESDSSVFWSIQVSHHSYSDFSYPAQSLVFTISQ